MRRVEITANRTSFPFSAYVVGYRYLYERFDEPAVGDQVQIQIGYYPANQVVEVTSEILATAEVLAVDERGTLRLRVAADTVIGARANLTFQPGQEITLPLRAVSSVLSIRVHEPDDASVFTDVPAAQASSLKRVVFLPTPTGETIPIPVHDLDHAKRLGLRS